MKQQTIEDVMKPAYVVDVTAHGEEILEGLGAQGIAILVDRERRRVLGITERWRLMKGDSKARLIDQIADKPYLVASVPIFRATDDVQVVENLPSRTTIAIVVDAKGDVVGTISPNEVWQLRQSKWLRK